MNAISDKTTCNLNDLLIRFARYSYIMCIECQCFNATLPSTILSNWFRRNICIFVFLSFFFTFKLTNSTYYYFNDFYSAFFRFFFVVLLVFTLKINWTFELVKTEIRHRSISWLNNCVCFFLLKIIKLTLKIH